MYLKIVKDGLLLKNKNHMIPKQLSQINYTPLNMNHPKRLSKLLILLPCIFFSVDIILLKIYITKRNQSSPRLTSSVKAVINEDTRPDTIQIIKTSSTSSKLNSQEPDIYGTTMQFTSYKLGLRFYYLTHWWKKTDFIEDRPIDVFVSRNANKVCIYSISSNSANCVGGQYILFFKKDIKISFKKTIEEELLKNNSKDCVINTHKSGDKEIAEIVPLTDKCSEIYSKKNIDRYFQYDSKFSDRFVFVSLSEHPILADTNYNTWEKTLVFF